MPALPLVNLTNLGLTFLLLLETAQIKRTLRKADEIDHSPPAVMELIQGWQVNG